MVFTDKKNFLDNRSFACRLENFPFIVCCYFFIICIIVRCSLNELMPSWHTVQILDKKTVTTLSFAISLKIIYVHSLNAHPYSTSIIGRINFIRSVAPANYITVSQPLKSKKNGKITPLLVYNRLLMNSHLLFKKIYLSISAPWWLKVKLNSFCPLLSFVLVRTVTV